jgi:hypothetical protein
MTREDLQTACYDVARETMRGQRPVDADEIQRLAERFYELATEQVQYVEGQGHSGALVLRAVRYLGSTRAIPPTRDTVYWFADMLSVLVELACPNSRPSPRNALFYLDLVRSLSETLASLAAPEEAESPEGGS